MFWIEGFGMTMNLKLAVVVVFSVGMIGSVVAQNQPSKSSGVRHTRIRQKQSNGTVHPDTKKLNADLARLEGQTSKTLGVSRRAPAEKPLPPAKDINQRERQSNPPINFNYKGKAGNTAHGGTHGKTTAATKIGPRMR